jgi:pimeloyl-ACP methyl ester carboxylesterase
MSRVVLVHGAFNELWGPHEILDRWVPALRDGLWHAGADVDPADIGCAFYGDLFRLDPDAGDVVEPADLAARSGLVDVLNSIPGADHLASLAHAVGEAANERLMDQLGRFLAAGDVRAAVRERMDRVLGPDTELVIAHSLGSLVSYQVLAARPELDPALITMGSPLATQFAFDRLRPPPVDGVGVWPGSVRSWTNIVAVGDPACGGKGLAHRFGDRVVDHLVDNGHRAHDPEPYLNAAVTGAAVARALGLVAD